MFGRHNKKYIFLSSFLAIACTNCSKDANSELTKFQDLKEISRNQSTSRIQFSDNSLFVDNERVPQMFGAELQYFRLRGGQGPNIEASKVETLWRKALTKMSEAGMNAICFYIPWDFHEYKEGHFDFEGKVDADNDGKPDYPSRNLKLFLKMVTEEFKFKHVMVRPGPYINAEWGFLGFGAVPEWFHDKYPHTHMISAISKRAKLYSYNSPELIKHTRLWFKALYTDVLKDYIGPGKPVFAMQIDNETNYQWQSIFNVDYSDSNQELFRDYLKTKYQSLAQLNEKYGTQYTDWKNLLAPKADSPIIAAKHDWHEYADYAIYKYLQKVQSAWLELGVSHKDVLFTLAESYNAAPNGLIPHLKQRNDPTTGMQTVNLYPKTAEPKGFPFSPLFNNPFKADHDVRLADAANDAYFLNTQKNEWVLGPEIQGGWWRGCEVKPEARMQTYLTTIGHGMKGLFVYYFTEGDNWDAQWERKQLRKIFDVSRAKDIYRDIPNNTLFTYDLNRPQIVNQFWLEVSNEYRKNVFYYPEDDLNWAQWTLLRSESELTDLYFDAPLDKNADPRPHFGILTDVGTKIVKPYGEWLGKAVELSDDVVILKDSRDNAHQNVPDLDSVLVNADWSAGLYSYLLHAGYNASFSAEKIDFGTAKVAVRYDYARVLSDEDALKYKDFISQGGVVVNFLEDALAKKLSLAAKSTMLSDEDKSKTLVSVSGAVVEDDINLKPKYARVYSELPSSCKPMLKWGEKVVGYTCSLGQGHFVQISASLHDIYNANEYYLAKSLSKRTAFIKSLLAQYVKNNMEVEGPSKVVSFARTHNKALWITAKSGEMANAQFKLKFAKLKLPRGNYVLKDVLAETSIQLSSTELQSGGVSLTLPPYGTKAYYLELAR